MNSRYLELDGKPWLPVMGEFHFSRYPAGEWEEELLKMKAAGVQIVATYVFWIHHEEIKGQFDWSGRRDLRHFLQLCAKHHLYAFVRIGPYAHGEVRNGGLPDWLVQAGPTRRNSPEYLTHVERYYNEIGRQLQGLFWKDDGPVIGIQLENEYFLKGRDAGAAHISTLKKLALAAGLDVPIYTVTGWDHPDFPANEVVPVFGVYPDAFWDSSLKPLPPSYGYLFSFPRDDRKSGDSLTAGAAANPGASVYPRLLAEAGGGMQVAYHRRPVISAADVAALAITQLGSGANLYGYYMFHGGANPPGKRTTLQESAATDGVYDLPVISYDFQAPLGQYGELRESYRELKSIHYFLNQFGDRLAPMSVFAPDRVPSGADDSSTPRAALRSDGHSGFLFLNNHRRDYPLADWKGVQFQINFAKDHVTFPDKPIDIPSGSYAIWPVNFDLNGVNLKFATAQLLCAAGNAQYSYFFFFAPSGIRADFSFDSTLVKSLRATGGAARNRHGQWKISGLPPGLKSRIEIVGKNENHVSIVLLSEDQAKNLWRVFDVSTGLLLSPADVFSGSNTIHFRSTDPARLTYGVFPEFTTISASPGDTWKRSHGELFPQNALRTTPRGINLSWKIVQSPASAPPVHQGKYNALAPTDLDFERAGSWQINLPANALTGLADLFLDIRYQGDVARLYDGDKLLDDHFFDGKLWRIGLRRFLDDPGPHSFEVRIAPLRKDAPIFLPDAAWPKFEANGEICEIESVTAVPLYEATVTFPH